MSHEPDSDDVHAPYVKQLTDAGDWAALARYWIAHWHGPALDGAIQCARARASRDGRWEGMAEYLEQIKAVPLDFERRWPRESLQPLVTEEEKTTVDLLQFFPRASVCEAVEQYPITVRNQVLDEGMTFAYKAMGLALRFTGSERQGPGASKDIAADFALLALFLAMLARTQQELRQWDAAVETYQKALELRRELAKSRPKVYRPYVAMTLNNLGTVLRASNNVQAAIDSYAGALDIYCELMQRSPGIYRIFVVNTLRNLAYVQHALDDSAAARASIEAAVTILGEATGSSPDVLRDSAETFVSFGVVESEANPVGARKALNQALGIYRRLAPENPGVYRPRIAQILETLAYVSVYLDDRNAVQACFNECLAIYHELALQQPEIYEPLIADTLASCGYAQFALKDFDGAGLSMEEALDIYRKLTADRPGVYEERVAERLVAWRRSARFTELGSSAGLAHASARSLPRIGSSRFGLRLEDTEHVRYSWPPQIQLGRSRRCARRPRKRSAVTCCSQGAASKGACWRFSDVVVTRLPAAASFDLARLSGLRGSPRSAA